MKSFLLSATSVAVLLTLFAIGNVEAQKPAGAAPVIGIVDISYIFKHHQRFQGQMEQMKQDAEATKAAITKERDRITKLMEQLKSYKPGTENYNKLEEDITHMQAEFNAKAALQQKDFMERESQVYLTVYKEVADAVRYQAERRNMAMVLRFNGDPVEPGVRESILRDINKPIVHYQPDADITPAVLEDLNRGGGAPRNAVRPGVPPRK